MQINNSADRTVMRRARRFWDHGGRRPDALLLLGLALLPFLVFSQQALARTVFYVGDVQYYFYPYHAAAAQIIKAGNVPLWNPYAFSGIPLLGDGQNALFYPPNWFFLVLPGPAALNYDVLVQFSIAGVGMYLYTRSLGAWRLPALIGALAYMFCGFMTARVVHLSIMSGAALIPLLFFCLERMLQTSSPRWFAAAAGMIALQAMAGHPQVAVYTALAVGLYLLVAAVERASAAASRRPLFQLPLVFAGLFGLGYALAAVQLLPWVDFSRLSPRAAAASFDFVFTNSTTGSEWLLLLFPYLYGALEKGPYAGAAMSIGEAIKTWEHTWYVGMLPLALAGVALLDLASVPRRNATGLAPGSLRQRRFKLAFFALLLAAAIVVAAGRHTPFAVVLYATPVVGKLRDVERALVLADFALTALAAYGMQRILEGRAGGESLRRRLVGVAAAIVLAPLLSSWALHSAALHAALGIEPPDVTDLTLHRPNLYVPLVLAGCSAALLLWWSRARAVARSASLAVLVVLLDVVAFAAVFNPTITAEFYRRTPRVVDFLRQDQGLFRKATFLPYTGAVPREPPADKLAGLVRPQEALIGSWSMAYGIEDINGFNSLQPRRYTDFLFSPETQDVSYGNLADERLLQPDSPILSMLNVKYLLVPRSFEPQVGPTFQPVYANDDVRVFENSQVLPRAYFVDRVRVEPEAQAVLRAVNTPGFDARREAVVESAVVSAAVAAAPDGAPAEVRIERYAPGRLELMASTAAPRLLVLSEMDLPGWHARIDGVETPIHRTNYLFRGIVVPAGDHTITMVYRPASVVVGLAVSLLALLVVTGLVLGPRRKRS